MEPISEGSSQPQPPTCAPPASIDQYIVATSDIRGGKPRIAGTRISVADIVIMHLRLGQSLEEIAVTYDLPLAALYAAMAYYYDHRNDIDKEIEEDRAFAASFRQNHPSRLKEKLEALALLFPTKIQSRQAR